MKIIIYRNKQNPNKYLGVHNDGYSHNAIRQFMLWRYKKRGVLFSETKNLTGDGRLHRWRVGNLKELLEDYELTKENK